MRTKKKPYITNAEESELKCLKTTIDEEVLGYEDLGPQKTREVHILGIWEEREWWDADSNSGISEAIVAHSFSKLLAPHTNGPRDVSRCWALNLLQKPLDYMGDSAETAATLKVNSWTSVAGGGACSRATPYLAKSSFRIYLNLRENIESSPKDPTWFE